MFGFSRLGFAGKSSTQIAEVITMLEVPHSLQGFSATGVFWMIEVRNSSGEYDNDILHAILDRGSIPLID